MNKKLIVLFTISALFVSGAQVPSEEGVLEARRAGQVQSFDASKQVLLRFWLQQLVASALYRDVVFESSTAEWQQRLAAPSRIYCRYPSPATLALPERRILIFDEVLLPIASDRSWPDYVFLKHGDSVLRLAKYDPWVLKKLLSEAGFPTSTAVDRALF